MSERKNAVWMLLTGAGLGAGLMYLLDASQSWRRRYPETSDDKLVERVRSKMGRYVSHPRAIEVMAQDGCVCLRGPILTHEAKGLLNAVRSVRGVRELDIQLEPHNTAETIPARRWADRRSHDSVSECSPSCNLVRPLRPLSIVGDF